MSCYNCPNCGATIIKAGDKTDLKTVEEVSKLYGEIKRLEAEIKVLNRALETVAGECNLLAYCDNDCKKCKRYRITVAIEEARQEVK